MTLPTAQPSISAWEESSIPALQDLAWIVANQAYHVPSGEPYRAVSRALYQQAVHERIYELFARSDRQNAQLDAFGQARGSTAPPWTSWPRE